MVEPQVRAITFDVGGTLIEPWPSVGDVYAQVAARHGVDVSPELLNQRFVAAWRAKKSFGYTKLEWSELVNQTFSGLAEIATSESFFSELYSAFAEAAAWKIYSDVRPALDQLRQRGITLGVISNWDERLRPLLRTLDLDSYFETIVVSGEVGHHKPAPEIFRAAAIGLKLPPENILHIGDSQTEDITGALRAGFPALLLTRCGTRAPGAIGSLDELPDKMR